VPAEPVSAVAEVREQEVARVIAIEGVRKGGVAAERFDVHHRLDVAVAVVGDDSGPQIGDGALSGAHLEEADPVADAVETFAVVGPTVERVDAAIAAHEVVIVAAVELVVAEPAAQNVIPAFAIDDVIAAQSDERVAAVAEEGVIARTAVE